MREFKVIDSAESVEKLRLRLKESEHDQFGDSFIPEYVYDAIRRHAQFSNMRVSFVLNFFFTVINMSSAVISRTPRSSSDSCSRHCTASASPS
jgi:hypothetical protein